MTALRVPVVLDVEAATDSELAHAGATGSSDAFAELYRRHAPAAVGVARSVLANGDDAADAVAEAFTKVFGAISAGRFPADVEFRSYLLTAARNAAVDHVRRTGRLAPTADLSDLDAGSPRRGPSDSIVASEESALVAQAFRDLPRRWQSVLWLTEVEGVPPREAAEVLGLTANNVSQLAARARARLRERFLQAQVRNHAGPRCQATVDRLGAYLAGTLPPGARQSVDDHLAGCGPCRARLAEVQDLGGALRRAAIPVPLLVELARRHGEERAGTRRGRHREPGADAESPVVVASGTAPGVTASGGPVVARTAPLVQTAATSPVAMMAAAVVAEPVGRLLARVVALVVGTVLAVLPGGEHRTPEPRAAAAAAASAWPSAVWPTTIVPPTTVPSTPETVPPPAPPAEPASTSAAPAPPDDAGPLPSTNHPRSTVAHAVGPVVGVYDGPDGAYLGDFENPLPSGAERVFLVVDRRDDWYQVLLPVRPNGRTGWVHRGEVSLSEHEYSIVVELGVHRITVFEGHQPVHDERIGVGKSNTPTPGGLYYTKELIEIEDASGRLNPNGPYGPFAFGLSGFSDVLFSFGAGGDGTVGIHGTNDPSSLGRDVSSGCIRMSNDGIRKLAAMLPLGVPVEVRP